VKFFVETAETDQRSLVSRAFGKPLVQRGDRQRQRMAELDHARASGVEPLKSGVAVGRAQRGLPRDPRDPRSGAALADLQPQLGQRFARRAARQASPAAVLCDWQREKEREREGRRQLQLDARLDVRRRPPLLCGPAGRRRGDKPWKRLVRGGGADRGEVRVASQPSQEGGEGFDVLDGQMAQ